MPTKRKTTPRKAARGPLSSDERLALDLAYDGDALVARYGSLAAARARYDESGARTNPGTRASVWWLTEPGVPTELREDATADDAARRAWLAEHGTPADRAAWEPVRTRANESQSGASGAVSRRTGAK